jgi:hypothetical protein
MIHRSQIFINNGFILKIIFVNYVHVKISKYLFTTSSISKIKFFLCHKMCCFKSYILQIYVVLNH